MNILRKLQSSDNYSVLDDFSSLDNYSKTEKAAKYFELCISYVVEESSDLGRLMNDKRAQNASKYIRYNIIQNLAFMKLVLKNERVIEVFSNVLFHYIRELKPASVSACAKMELIAFNHVLAIVLNSTNESKLFSNKFHDYNGTKNTLVYLDENDLMEKCAVIKRTDVSMSGKEPTFLRAIASIVLNLTNIADSRKEDFRSLNTTEIILKFLKGKTIDDDFRMCAYLILANLMNDNEIETLPHTKIAVDGLVKLLRRATATIASNQSVHRLQVLLDIDGEETHADVCMIDGAWYLWHIDEIFNGLYRISVNDKMKFEIFETIGVRDDIKKTVLYGTDAEKAFAMKLLWQMCFSPKVVAKLKEDKDLLQHIQTISRRSDVKIKNLQSYAKGILWSIDVSQQQQTHTTLLGAGSTPKMQQQVSPVEINSAKKKHVMISYNRESRDLCLKIKDELTKSGYKVWIDVEQIEGSSLDSMARAVENSVCILLCMSEKYKQSAYCRAEAEYTFMRKVPFIPLVMQKDYTADGWLGIIVGSKVNVNFAKYGFEDGMKKVQFQLQALLQNSISENEVKNSPVKSSPTTSANGAADVKNWSHSDVQNWLSKNQIDQNICKTLRNFNGEMLKQLNSVKKTAPDYFFTAISQNNTVELFSVVQFSNEFDKLF